MSSLTEMIARKTMEYRCAYISDDFVENLYIKSGKHKVTFHKILWDYLPDSDPEVIKLIAKEIGSAAVKTKADIILGVESSGIAAAAIASVMSGLKFGFIRKVAKSYGLRKLIEGEFGNQKRVVVVDNFLFSGGTIQRSLESVRRYGLKPVLIVCVDGFTKLNKSKKIGGVPIKILINNQRKVEYLIKHGYFPETLARYIKMYITKPSLFFGDSELHTEYTNHLYREKSTDIIKIFNRKNYETNSLYEKTRRFLLGPKKSTTQDSS